MIRAGETFIWGRDQATARALLDAAEELELGSGVVRTTENGFVVPDAVADAAHPQLVSQPGDPATREAQF